MKKKVLVVVIGWWNALDKHIDKYSAIYRRFGYHTYTYNPSGALFFKPWRYDKETQPILRNILLMAEEQDCDKIVFHGFSNNGCLLYHSFKRNFESIECNVHVVGAIFDSCPGIVNLRSFSKALFAAQISPVYKFSPVLPIALAPSFLLTTDRPLFGVVAFCVCYLSSTFYLQKKYEHNHTMTNIYFTRIYPGYEELYLYSKTDKVVGYKVIEAAIDRIRKANGKVTDVKFENSGHCAHYPKYPMKYNKAVLKFIKHLELKRP